MQAAAGSQRLCPRSPDLPGVHASAGSPILVRRQHSPARGTCRRSAVASYSDIRLSHSRSVCSRPARQEAAAINGLSASCRRCSASSGVRWRGGSHQQRSTIRRTVRLLCTDSSPQQGRLRHADAGPFHLACSPVAARASCEGVLPSLLAARCCLWCQAAELVYCCHDLLVTTCAQGMCSSRALCLRQVRQHHADALAEPPDVLADAELAAALGAASDAGSEQSPERRQTRQSRRPPRYIKCAHRAAIHQLTTCVGCLGDAARLSRSMLLLHCERSFAEYDDT